MKLVRFSQNGQAPRLGSLQGDRIADLQASLASTLAKRGVARAQAIAAALIPNSTREFLEGGAASQDAVASITEWVTVPRNAARLHAPIADPSKFICIGLNYRDHAEESELDLPEVPVIFAKWTTSLIGHGETIVIPREETRPDYEGEVAVVIGEPVYRATGAAARTAVGAYTCFHDVSGRRAQLETPLRQFTYGKSFDTFGPLGPWLVTKDEIANVQKLDMWLDVNGEKRQRGNTKTMIFGIAHIVWYCSQFFVMEPGDIITTGTPPGVALGMKPNPVWLKPSDTVSLGIEGLGEQKQKIVKFKN